MIDLVKAKEIVNMRSSGATTAQVLERFQWITHSDVVNAFEIVKASGKYCPEFIIGACTALNINVVQPLTLECLNDAVAFSTSSDVLLTKHDRHFLDTWIGVELLLEKMASRTRYMSQEEQDRLKELKSELTKLRGIKKP